MNSRANNTMSALLKKREEQDAYRHLIINDGMIDFCSNDYLGFAHSIKLKKAINKAYEEIEHFNNGSGGSRLLAGNTSFAEKLEADIASFHNAEAGLIYNSGYDANVGLFSSVCLSGDTIIYDELIHASVHDGIRLSRASSFMFKHNDLLHLEERLKVATGVIYVAVESIYSMDGDHAPLFEIVTLCKKYGAELIVDEAHATGITINGGKGRVQELGIESSVFARLHTFGKGLGCHGAIVLGSDLLRNYLINFSRSFIYTTALPLHSLVAIQQAYLLLQNSAEDIFELNDLIEYFRIGISQIDTIECIESKSAIQCFIIPGNSNAKKLALTLQKNGFDVRAILSPTVPKGKERIRICLHVFNTREQIDLLISIIKGCLPTM